MGVVHILVEEADEARAALDSAGLEISAEHEVEISKVEDRPGALLELLKSYSDADRNIEVLYTSSKGVVVGAEDMLKPRYGVRMEDTTT